MFTTLVCQGSKGGGSVTIQNQEVHNGWMSWWLDGSKNVRLGLRYCCLFPISSLLPFNHYSPTLNTSCQILSIIEH